MFDVSDQGLFTVDKANLDLAPVTLIEMALKRGEGTLADNGAFVAYTSPNTGRAAKDKFIVRTAENQSKVDWGDVNHPMDEAAFDRLFERVRAHLKTTDLIETNAVVCAEPKQRVPVRLYAEKAWHVLFAQCLFMRKNCDEATPAALRLTILAAPHLKLDPARDEVRSEAAIVLHLERGIVLIAGTLYAGEIKKSVFTYLNYWLPHRGVFPMHCGATLGEKGDAALLFGLSGTGKTTLSADPNRKLIGDDEHGWSDQGVFNFEGGCYAKTVRLSKAGEPQIWQAIRFGAVLENVVLDPQTRRPDYDNISLTENTRAAYPLEHIDGLAPNSCGGHPRHIFFLTCDAFGVLPPLARLTGDQALYHFLSGYTAKVAGTEKGVTEPQAVFSTCFAAPFLVLHPAEYARLLQERLKRYQSQVWLVNTGWSGGGAGQASRMPLAVTRALVKAVLDGEMDKTSFETEPYFGLSVPTNCPGVSPRLLQPRSSWPDPANYDRQAATLASMFHKNFEKFASSVTPEVRRAGPASTRV